MNEQKNINEQVTQPTDSYREKIVDILNQNNVDPNDYDMVELIKGVEVEKEHGSKLGQDTNVTDNELWPTIQIALAHLMELPDYYSRLEKMEREAGVGLYESVGRVLKRLGY